MYVAGVVCFVSILTTTFSVYTLTRLRLWPGHEPFVFTENGWTLFRGDVSVHKMTLLNHAAIHLDEGRIQGDVTFQVKSRQNEIEASMKVRDDAIEVRAKHGLRVYSPDTGLKSFPPDFGHFRLPDLKHLGVPNGLRDVKRIRSPLQQPLSITSESLRLQANGGLNANAKSVQIQAQSLHLNSLNGSIVLQAPTGNIYLKFASEANERAGRSADDAAAANEVTADSYKLCVCSDSGLLFKISLKDAEHTSCADVRFPVSQNPCPKS